MITTISGTVITEVATMSHFIGTMSSILITRAPRNRPPSANLRTERNRWVPYTLNNNFTLIILVTSVIELPNLFFFSSILFFVFVFDSHPGTELVTR